MLKPTVFSAAIGLACALASAAPADTKPPAGAKPADPQTIANAHVGKTFAWKSCNGGVYYGGGWEAQAWCNKDGPSVGIGTWSVDRKGRVCQELTWYWPEGDGVGSKTNPVRKQDCHSHVIDTNGEVWRHWDGGPDWWRFENTSNMSKGFKFKSRINRLRRKLGV